MNFEVENRAQVLILRCFFCFSRVTFFRALGLCNCINCALIAIQPVCNTCIDSKLQIWRSRPESANLSRHGAQWVKIFFENPEEAGKKDFFECALGRVWARFGRAQEWLVASGLWLARDRGSDEVRKLTK